MAVVLFVALILVAVEAKSFDPERAQKVEKRSSVCFDKIGCFTTDPPFSDAERGLSVVPQSPDKIQTKYQLHTREAPAIYQEVDARHPETVATKWTNFAKRPTQFIIHGFLNNPDNNAWLKTMKDELLKAGDFNVVIVNWAKGDLPPYTVATANSRVVGAQLALLIQELIKTKGVSAGDFHVIGHSLGAHIGGYAGERVPGLGRITGLDPAGPYFDDSDITVRLDPSDAVFVDVIHTDAKNILHLGFGTREQGGHVDFYPNLGHDQPGCTRSPIYQMAEYGFTNGLKEVVACNHLRSIKFFTESINSKCPFVAFPCDSEDAFAKNNCLECPAGGCPSIGYRAINQISPSNKQVKYFLTTASKAPFCQYHLALTVKFSAGMGKQERGSILVTIKGDKATTQKISVTDPIDIIPGTTYKFNLGVPSDIGSVQSVSFTWDHDSSLLKPSEWNILGFRHPTLFVDEVEVKNEESNLNVRFCVNGGSVETDKTLAISTRC